MDRILRRTVFPIGVDPAAVKLNYLLCNGKAKSGAAGLAAAGFVGSEKLFKNIFDMLDEQELQELKK